MLILSVVYKCRRIPSYDLRHSDVTVDREYSDGVVTSTSMHPVGPEFKFFTKLKFTNFTISNL